jgi:Ca-activated chloride channel homolog
MRILLRRLLLFALMSFAGLSDSRAESLPSKNRKGNQFYTQGRYADAEKKYLDAQVNNPGNSTILYNLGNALIRQKKYDQAIQALNQAIEKGDKTTKENSWYNAGNALFDMEKFKDSADAFIQALKLNPADKDAKHNLELALMKLKEQKQEQESKKDSSSKQDQNSSQNQNPSGNKDRPEPQNQKRENAGQNQKEQNEPAKQDVAQAPRREGTVGKDRALQILDAVQNQETDEQRKILERRARQQAGGKDW